MEPGPNPALVGLDMFRPLAVLMPTGYIARFGPSGHAIIHSE